MDVSKYIHIISGYETLLHDSLCWHIEAGSVMWYREGEYTRAHGEWRLHRAGRGYDGPLPSCPQLSQGDVATLHAIGRRDSAL